MVGVHKWDSALHEVHDGNEEAVFITETDWVNTMDTINQVAKFMNYLMQFFSFFIFLSWSSANLLYLRPLFDQFGTQLSKHEKSTV